GPCAGRRTPGAAPRGLHPYAVSIRSSARLAWPLPSLSVGDYRVGALAGQHLRQTARLVDREYQDGDAILTCQGDRRRIHHLEVAREHLEMGQLLETL